MKNMNIIQSNIMKIRLLTLLFASFVLAGCEPGENVGKIEATVIESFELNMPGNVEFNYGYFTDILVYTYSYNEEYGNWSGFAQSRSFDMEDTTYNNQYGVYNDKAASGTHFAMYYYDSYSEPTDILCRYFGNYQFKTVRLNLSTITYNAIVNGNDYARAFKDGDYLKVSFIALGENKTEGAVVDYYAVDFRDGKRFIAKEWDMVDISALKGNLWGVRIRIETTDVGEWGANTPLYICLDDLIYTYES